MRGGSGRRCTHRDAREHEHLRAEGVQCGRRRAQQRRRAWRCWHQQQPNCRAGMGGDHRRRLAHAPSCNLKRSRKRWLPAGRSPFLVQRWPANAWQRQRRWLPTQRDFDWYCWLRSTMIGSVSLFGAIARITLAPIEEGRARCESHLSGRGAAALPLCGHALRPRLGVA